MENIWQTVKDIAARLGDIGSALVGINRHPDIHPPAKPTRTALKTESRILYLSGTRPHQINPCAQ